MSAKPKISILTLNMGSGGAEKVISVLLPKLIKDYDVNLVLFDNIIHFEIPKEVNLFLLNKRCSSLPIFKPFLFFVNLLKYGYFLKKNGIKISVSFLTRPNLVNGLIKIFTENIAVILSERCYPSIAYRSNQLRFHLYKLLFPMIYNQADMIFSNSEYINEDLKTNFGIKCNLKVIYNPIEPKNVSVDRVKQSSDFDILWVGKLVTIKNPNLFIKALNNLKFPFNAHILGDGFLMNDLIGEAKINIGVKFYGRVDNVNEYMQSVDCFVLTSNSEGFPNVIIEAMLCGLPIISTNCLSGPLEILNSGKEIDIPQGEYTIVDYGILINVDDNIALVKALNVVYEDHDLRKRLAEKSCLRVKDFYSDKIYEKFKLLINDVIRNKK